MVQHSKLFAATILVVLLCCTGATWMVSPGKGSHATGGGAAAFRSISSTTYASRTNTTITAPTGIINGDILILYFSIGAASPPTPTLPSGFTTIVGPTGITSGGFTNNHIVAWKLASGESGSYTVTHASASSEGVIVCVSGAADRTPVTSDNTGTGQTTTALGVTTPSNNSLVIFMSMNWVLFGTATPPTGTTPTFTDELLDSSSTIVYMASGVLATAGATGNKTQSNGNGVSDPWAATMVALGP